MSAQSSSTVSPAAQPSQTGGGGGGGGPTSSPLLFFVALGFGVVFTNLWIIVGVKYCFRYNQRNRAARAAADGDPIDLTAMPRPHRRRREKKLMTMEEVNDRFPLIKYKAWKVTREDEGLPTAGGINTAPQSRATSIKDVEGAVASVAEDSASGQVPKPPTVVDTALEEHVMANASTKEQSISPRNSCSSPSKAPEKTEKIIALMRSETEGSKDPKTNEHDVDGDESDDDDPIRTAAAPELLGEPGDTCAICLDTLEDDDDVRGLTCGHAFHASCVDPWLTSRRACCPLCKADYYVPKPRPEGEAMDQSSSGRRSAVTGLRSPTAPPAAWVAVGANPFARSRVAFIAGPSQGDNSPNGNNRIQSVLARPSRQRRGGSSDRTQRSTQSSTAPSWRTRLRSAGRTSFPSRFGRNRGNRADSNSENQPTPGQLEAGNR